MKPRFAIRDVLLLTGLGAGLLAVLLLLPGWLGQDGGAGPPLPAPTETPVPLPRPRSCPLSRPGRLS